MTAVMEVAARVAAALEHCGAAYAIGGSLASSLSGEPRDGLGSYLQPQAVAAVADLLARARRTSP